MIKTRFFCIIAACLAVGQLNAATVTHEFSFSFGAVTPDGPAPYATAVFDDGGSPGTVTLAIEVAASVGIADVTELYFNLEPSLDPTSLSISRTGGTGPSAGNININTGVNAFQADGDGKYDIYIDLPPPPGNDSAL